jgi:sugar/nucleoside kinase (ribokinase family)
MSAATPAIDVIAIGNAIIDVIADTNADFLAAEGLAPGSMRLIDAERAVELFERMGQGETISGGAAANSLSGLARLGKTVRFVGQVADDALGARYGEDLRSAGVHFDTAPIADGPPTGRCLILVSPGGERTMNTFLGAAQNLPVSSIAADAIAAARVLFLEGYLWDSDVAREAMRTAIAHARAHETKVALATCADFCVHQHKDDFRALIAEGAIDMLFANEEEAVLLAPDCDDWEAALRWLSASVPLVVITRSSDGAVAAAGARRADVAAQPVERVVDATGAGDLFAAGFLAAHLDGRSLDQCLTAGSIAAAEVISHYGARPVADLRALTAAVLG